MDKADQQKRYQNKLEVHSREGSRGLQAKCIVGKDFFAGLLAFGTKYEKATECLAKDWTALTRYFDFPASHWLHIRTTNAIESVFATVKLRTRTTKDAGNPPKAAAALAFKLMIEAQKRWRKVRGTEELPRLLSGVV